jgi:cation diffusion facilitator CzcD-associated flavoprotein CzcO
MSQAKPHLAILGAGPTGLEAALAAADQGFPFTLYETGAEVAAQIRSWGHVRLFSPWSLNVSPRMRRHLDAAGLACPSDESCPTGFELIADLLEPLAALPAIAPHLRLETQVLSISREGLLKHEEIGSAARRERPFRLLLSGPDGTESIAHAEIVFDCTGNYRNPNYLGDGGIPAPGEAASQELISRWIPDLSKDADSWANQTTLLVGSGYSAQTAVCDFAELAAKAPDTKLIWALRKSRSQFKPIPDDPLPERARLTANIQELLEEDPDWLKVLPKVVVESITLVADANQLVKNKGSLEVVLRHPGGVKRRRSVDQVLSLTGYVGDHRIYRQLQVHECYATSGPMKLAAALLGSAAGGDGDCLTQESHGPDTLKNPEPNFFILGSKAYGRNTTFLMRVGWQQVDEVFGMLRESSADQSSTSQGSI